jgi:predicted dehydrogenase
MNTIVIGLGSMGKRRIRLLLENFPEISVSGVDQNIDRCNAVSHEFHINTYSSIQEAISREKINYAFVCISPLSHAEIITFCLTNDMHVFAELNLVDDGYHDNIALAKKNNLILFLSSTFLYRTEIQFLIEKIHQSNSKLSYTYHVGQYLPDWHPWENISDFFVGNKRTNGCREIFAIELPWLIRAFGKVRGINVRKDNISSLPLGYPDIYFVTIEHESGHTGQLCVDVVTRMPLRHFEVFGEDLQIEWRGTPEELRIANDGFTEMQIIKQDQTVERIDGYHEFIVENAYLEEVKEFFYVCRGKANDTYTFLDDLYTLNLIDQIEQ